MVNCPFCSQPMVTATLGDPVLAEPLEARLNVGGVDFRAEVCGNCGFTALFRPMARPKEIWQYETPRGP